MITTARITDYDGINLTVKPNCLIDRELMKKQVDDIEIRFNDGRTISAKQRKFIFALIRDIASWSGYYPEEIRPFLEWDFIGKNGGATFSLSDVDMTTARSFLDYLIEFCMQQNVPTKKSLLYQNDNIGCYLYNCLEYRKCTVCNDPAEVHHVDRIGMGRDREKIVHVGLEAIALCRKHHDEAHHDEKKLFEREHIYGIALDEYLCKKLNLGKAKAS